MSRVKVKVAVLGSSSLVSLTVSVDVKQHRERNLMRAHEPRESQGGHPGLLVPSKPYGFCGRKATLRKELDESQELCESQGGCTGLPAPNSLYSLYGCKATMNWNWAAYCTVLHYLVL